MPRKVSRMAGVEGVPGNAGGARDGGHAPAQGGNGVAITGGCEIGADDGWCGRHGGEAVLLAPCGEGFVVGFVRLDGRGRIGSILIRAGFGE
jgi:hypothetical protein